MSKCILCYSHNLSEFYPKTRENDHHKILKCNSCSHIQLSELDYDPFTYYNENKQDDSIFKIADRSKTDFYNMLNNQALNRLKYIDSLIIELITRYDIVNICDNVNIINSMLTSDISNQYFEFFLLVTCFHVLEHIFTPIEFMHNLSKLVCKNGYLVIEVPNQNNALINLSSKYVSNIWYLNAHVSYFTPDKLKYLANLINFTIIKIKGFQRYGLLNFLHWIQYNEPLKLNNTWYNGTPSHQIEEQWINDITNNLISDAIYMILSK